MGTRTRSRPKKAAEEAVATAPPEKIEASSESPSITAQGAPPELLEQLHAAAAAFGGDDAQVSRMLATMAEDVRRARACPLPIFPVLHHSPASAVHMVRWLHERAPKVVFVELCEDLLPVARDLAGCKLPVALQAFSGEAEGFPPEWAPLSVVAPITEFSAEFQAIAYAISTGAELVFVDRSVDHVFQARGPDEDEDDDEDLTDEDDESETAGMHGDAVGLEVGSFATFREFREFLLHNARMGQLEEWMSLYVEEPTIGASTETYREVLFLVGSLFRRLGSTPRRREEIRVRDRYMWTRIKERLAAKDLDPKDAVFICGAAHAVDDNCPEWGLDNDLRYDIPARTTTRWQYGLIPSSYGAIEHQFGYDRGAVALAEARWHKARDTQGIVPFGLGETKKSRSTKAPKISLPAPPAPRTLQQVIAEPPGLLEADREELLHWCTGIVESARAHQYLASTADAIAIYETAVLLARVRARNRPSPSDFVDAAETCLEKGQPPGKKSIRMLARSLLGGDRIGQVAYESLPPLVQDVYDRLAVLGITAKTSRVTRVLMDFGKDPHLREVSALLWRLHHLLPGTRVARPIMGKLELGAQPSQESWDVCVHGAEQRAVIQLSFEGLTVETVLERRLREATFGPDARTVTALSSVETSLVLLDNPKLTESIGQYSVQLLALERGADDAAKIFEQIRKLVHHFRTTPQGPPRWLNDFVAHGYQHYTTQLPEAFQDRGTSPEALSAMLSFVFTLESLALAMGCSRSQLVLSLEHATTQTSDPEKLGLLWASRWLVQLSDEASIRASFAEILEHPLGRTAYPRYLSGFLLALSFAPRAAALAVDLLGRAFAELPDRVLLPWMPALIDRLRPRMNDALPVLFQEFARSAPKSLKDLDRWSPPWSKPLPQAAPAQAPAAKVAKPKGPVLSETARLGRALLFAHRAAPTQHAAAMGLTEAWGTLGQEAVDEAAQGTAEAPSEPGASGEVSAAVLAVRALLSRSPGTAAFAGALRLS